MNWMKSTRNQIIDNLTHVMGFLFIACVPTINNGVFYNSAGGCGCGECKCGDECQCGD